MSVINKMLRDLDARQTQAPLSALHGTWTLGGAGTARRAGWPHVVLAAALVSVMWWVLSPQPATPGRDWTLEVPVTQAPLTHAPLTVQFEAAPMQLLDSEGTSHDTLAASKEEVLEATRRPGAALPMSLMLKLSGQMLMPTDLKPSKKNSSEPQSNVASEVVAIQKEASALPPSPQAVSQLPATTPSPSPPAPLAPLANPVAAAAGPGAAVTPNTATAVPVVTVNRQLALQENVQQAQQMWQSGSREAATEVLRSTLQSVERSTEVSSAETIHVLREWARMALALDRTAEVMALIKRHAGQLHVQGQGSGHVQADIWALQGHAAQRLGLHNDAVEAYQHALLSRPNEGRWLLASAVSLAASGQLESAARQLQKVRAQGPVNPDILAYLKQAGVVLP